MATTNQINETYDYAMFRTLAGNRTVSRLHVRRLIDSFQESYLISPIIVNDKYEIIDGQHRFEAAKETGKPVYYIVAPEYGLKEVQMLNENMKNWVKLDYLNAYCDLKYPEYLKLRNFMRKYTDFGIATSLIILTNDLNDGRRSKHNSLKSETNKSGSYIIRTFEEGDLEIPDYNLAVENTEKILMVKPYYDGFNRRAFVAAMIMIFKKEHYNHNQLIGRLKSNPTALQHCVNITQYKSLIEEIYNYRSREKVSLRF